MERRCAICGAYLHNNWGQCDCGSFQTEGEVYPRMCRMPARAGYADEASRTGEDWRWEKRRNDQYQRRNEF
nr:MAG TPA: hypothetical protein [Caudoviricetes sp.]